MGTSTGAPTTDIRGSTRYDSPDIGAYEYTSCFETAATLYVDASRAVSGNGQTWASAYKSLDEALALAHLCPIVDTIKVAVDIYP